MVLPTSLPLMGIVNAKQKTDELDAETLITPHGDRKLAPAPGSATVSATHYPSWGS